MFKVICTKKIYYTSSRVKKIDRHNNENLWMLTEGVSKFFF